MKRGVRRQINGSIVVVCFLGGVLALAELFTKNFVIAGIIAAGIAVIIALGLMSGE